VSSVVRLIGVIMNRLLSTVPKTTIKIKQSNGSKSATFAETLKPYQKQVLGTGPTTHIVKKSIRNIILKLP
jgi:hypothetical protein